MLRRKGTLVAIGNASGPPDPISPLKLSAKNLKLVRPTRVDLLYRSLHKTNRILCRMGNYLVTPEEAHPYYVELLSALKTGLFKIRVEAVYPFSVDGVRQAQAELATPGNKLAGKVIIKISEDEE